jgi:hypothetical protein
VLKPTKTHKRLINNGGCGSSNGCRIGWGERSSGGGGADEWGEEGDSSNVRAGCQG